ncbi:hypothetical protein D3C85_1257020 [compost metagenome]
MLALGLPGLGRSLGHLTIYPPMAGIFLLGQVIGSITPALHVHRMRLKPPHLAGIVEIEQASSSTTGLPPFSDLGTHVLDVVQIGRDFPSLSLSGLVFTGLRR